MKQMAKVASETTSCRSALIDDARHQITLGKKNNKTTTDLYLQARQTLLEESVKSRLHRSGSNLDKATHRTYRWHDRRVVMADGSTLSMPDTKVNQAEYRQPKSQKKLGFYN